MKNDETLNTLAPALTPHGGTTSWWNCDCEGPAVLPSLTL